MVDADYLDLCVEVDWPEVVDTLADFDDPVVVFALWAWVDGGFTLEGLERRAEVRLGIRLMRLESIFSLVCVFDGFD